MASVIEVEPQVPAPNPDALYEIIDGQVVELPPMSIYAAFLAFRISSIVDAFARANNLGIALAEGLFRLPLPRSRNRRPDGAYVSYRRWAKGRPLPTRDNAWDVVPDLGIEVISPTDGAIELMEKIAEYFQAGMEQVWVVYPDHRLVHVYESITAIKVLTHADDLAGGSVLPGFHLPLSELFQPEAQGP
jgi:Uma2 family endonuclease